MNMRDTSLRFHVAHCNDTRGSGYKCILAVGCYVLGRVFHFVFGLTKDGANDAVALFAWFELLYLYDKWLFRQGFLQVENVHGHGMLLMSLFEMLEDSTKRKTCYITY